MKSATLTTRALNRALLARQHLLARTRRSALEMIEHLVGLQAQSPARLLAPFDNLVLSHADRTRIMSPEVRQRFFTQKNGMVPGAVLVDGFVAGCWSLEERRGRATLRVETLAPLAPRDHDEIRAEGERLLEFAAPAGSAGEVIITAAA